ncbi:MAG: hypothetical protein PHW64_08785 [Sulfuricurvum sp.]|nr:hypothetical protein [Sulfuricurvum sp.]
MSFSPQQLQVIKESSERYKDEVNRINTLINSDISDAQCDTLYLLRTLSTIEHGNRIGLFNEENSDEFLEALAREVNRYFPEKDDEELYDDLAILEDDLKERFFADPEKEKTMLLKGLGLSL